VGDFSLGGGSRRNGDFAILGSAATTWAGRTVRLGQFSELGTSGLLFNGVAFRGGTLLVGGTGALSLDGASFRSGQVSISATGEIVWKGPYVGVVVNAADAIYYWTTDNREITAERVYWGDQLIWEATP
jgi:hypothetical protein